MTRRQTVLAAFALVDQFPRVFNLCREAIVRDMSIFSQGVRGGFYERRSDECACAIILGDTESCIPSGISRTGRNLWHDDFETCPKTACVLVDPIWEPSNRTSEFSARQYACLINPKLDWNKMRVVRKSPSRAFDLIVNTRTSAAISGRDVARARELVGEHSRTDGWWGEIIMGKKILKASPVPPMTDACGRRIKNREAR